ncbi:crocetin glucosyltransferase, chloroplastic-like [Iris pallida]|uniref:Crocetin glucosyltransferase, chloroplastic-like n=1 Tax=Iris pallida TaxID=29817 RepID=A0AAX6DN34_IRIPA|nr:crocetin glucosyltransferase, chloroplastic-like [Iris pallida]
MFPSLAAPDDEVQDGPVAHIPFSDGFDEGFVAGTHDARQYLSQLRSLGSSSVSSILQRLRDRGRPVDCVVYTFFLPWASDVARANGVPSAQYWIQPATVFAIYYHYFHSYSSLINNACDPMSTIKFACLPPIRARDLPSFLTVPSDDPSAVILDILKDTFDTLDRERALSSSKPIVLMNTFAELEEDALSAVEDLALIPIGPILSPSDAGRDLFKLDEKGYMEWLDSNPTARSCTCRSKHDSLEEGADGGDPERDEGQRAAVPVGAAEGVQMGGAGAAGRRRERHGGRVVLAGGGAVASFGRVLRDALRVELDLREPGLWSADGRGAAVDGPGDERHAGGEEVGDRSEGRGQRGGGVGT